MYTKHEEYITSCYTGPNTWFVSHLQGENEARENSLEVRFRFGEALKQNSAVSVDNKWKFL